MLLPPVASHCELSRTCVPLFPESAVENSFQVATLALLPAAHHQLCLASQATRCDSQQKRTSFECVVWDYSIGWVSLSVFD